MLKVAVIGAGSTYMPELIDGFIKRKDVLDVAEFRFMDIDEPKLRVVGSLAVRMLEKTMPHVKVVMTLDLDEALREADFVLAQIRVGRLPARILDEKIPLKYGLLGQETTGIGGFFNALRTVPVMLDISKRMEALCPNAWMINFSNPSGIVADALISKGVRMMGLCNVPIGMTTRLMKDIGIENAKIEYLGLNHLSWITAVRGEDGTDYLQEALQKGFTGARMANIPDTGFDLDCMRAVGAIPSSYLQYFYFRERKLKQQLEAKTCRGEDCVVIEEQLLEMYRDVNLYEKPALLDKRGGFMYSEAAVALVDAIHNDKREVHVVNIANGDALEFMNSDDVVEISALVGKNGAEPVKVRDFSNRHIIGLMQAVKAYEKLAAEAALTGSDELALQALTVHPLIGDFDKAKACYLDMKKAHKNYLPQFTHED